MKPNIIPQLFDTSRLNCEIENNPKAISTYKSALKSAQQTLYDLFDDGTSVDLLVSARSQFVDDIIGSIWQHFFSDKAEVALLAVGGYGRAELHPHSDIDIMLLFKNDDIDEHQSTIEKLFMFLWDIGLEIGSSVRSIKECVEEAGNDITIATNIVESRCICGSMAVYEAFEEATSPTLIWSSKDFFEAKVKEQQRRYQRFHDTAYNLEPNIKESPGGLRDIHMIGWITKRHFGDKSLADLVHRGFLTENEYNLLKSGQDFLWKIRFALHKLANRREDRLSFEYQRILADDFGYENESNKGSEFGDTHLARSSDGRRLAVEVFMKDYFRTIQELSLLNDMLLQHYQETILFDPDKQTVKPINKRFQAVASDIEVTNPKVFIYYPFALLEIFLQIQQRHKLKGIRSSTIRLIREHLHLIDDEFRNDLRCKSLFMEILRQPRGVTFALRSMSRYGILAKYLPEFGKIEGQMQFDLFHVYTVDEHTLFVVRNIRRFFVAKFKHEFPLCSQLIGSIPKPELLYVAGIYHDIAKGRGGDHSVLGEDDARQFCLRHGLSHYDTELVAWLVRNHLLMSSTAQHKDLSDPDVINEFASKVESNIKLDYLYLLTVADIRGTNNSLWNSWKDSLLKTLRSEAQKAIRRGLSNPLQKDDFIQQTKKSAMQLIEQTQMDTDVINVMWDQMGDDYFLRYTPNEILRHTKEIIANPDKEVIVNIEPKGSSGGTDIFIRCPVQKDLFASTTLALDSMSLNIVEARIVTSNNNCSLNTYTVLDLHGNNIEEPYHIEEIRQNILNIIDEQNIEGRQKDGAISRRIECFAQPTVITWEDDVNNGRTILEIITTDRPGLLSRIALALMNHGIETLNAKIATLGAHVDDVFIIYDADTNSCVASDTMDSLKKALTETLDCR